MEDSIRKMEKTFSEVIETKIKLFFALIIIYNNF